MANHIASISSSSRATRLHESGQLGETPSEPSTANGQGDSNLESSVRSDLAKMCALSLSDDDDDLSNVSSKLTSTRPPRSGKKRASTASSAALVRPDLLSSKLEQLESSDDIDANISNTDLYHCNALQRIELKWADIAQNLADTMGHLQDCSQQVTDSSTSCLEALHESVGTTCDNVDDELKAFYHLMTKCDELTTKLSIATSFRDEIKTLRKSIETLEQLYKNKQPRASAAAASL